MASVQTLSVPNKREYRVNEKISRTKYWLRLLLLIAIYILTFYFIEWTEDRYNYEQLLTNIDNYNTDIFFTWIARMADKRNWSYEEVYHFHIILQAVFFGLFSAKEFKKPFLPCVIAILLNFVNIANQLRYFAGFWAFLYGMTFYDKRKLVYFLLGVFACLNHITLIVLFLCLPLRKLLLKINARRYIIIALTVFIVTPMLIFILPGFLETFSKYVEQEDQSSFLGGVFNLFPTFFFVILFYLRRARYGKYEASGDRLVEILCIFSFVFIPISVIFQLFSQRFVFTFISVWIAYLIDKEENKTKILYVTLLSVFTILWFYLAPLYFLGYSYYFDNVLVMIGIKPFLSI